MSNCASCGCGCHCGQSCTECWDCPDCQCELTQEEQQTEYIQEPVVLADVRD